MLFRSASQLRDCLDNATIRSVQSSAALLVNTSTKNNAHEVFDKNDGAQCVPSQISLMFSIAVDDSFCPHAYALLCQRKAGGTLFLPPTVVDAIRLTLPTVWSDGNNCKDDAEYIKNYEKLMLSWIENSLSSSLSWARGYLSTTEKLRAFGLYAPVVDSSAPNHDSAQGYTSNVISERSTIILWSDTESLISIQIGNDMNSSRIDEDALHISLLCPIPLPGVGTLGVSGPPRCTVGSPRNVTSEEEDRIKRRCISIGEVSLIIAKVAEKKSEQITHCRKKQRKVPSYYFCCGQLSHLKAFTEASGLIPTDLYSTLAREILQHAFKRHPFSPSQPSHSYEVPVLSLSLTLQPPIAEDSNGEEALSALSNAYCSVRPLLEFVLLVSSYASASDSSAVASAPTSSSSGSNGVIGNKSILKIISLDCQSRCEPFIVCALYNIVNNSGGVGNASTSTSTSTSDLVTVIPHETLIGFIEVEIVRSSIDTKETLDTPYTAMDRTRSDSTVTDDQISRKTEKFHLKVSGISVDFQSQIIEMAVFRECFQKKFQAMTGRNPFHAFVNKLVSSFSLKSS